jgi:erythromycin esterase-like protein
MDMPRWRGLLAAATAATTALAGGATATAAPSTQPVSTWVGHHATPLTTVDPGAPLTDLTPLRRYVGTASVVGLGESTHGAAELLTLKHRMLRLLVERLGFRSIAWEEDWTLGRRIDAYIRTGRGDPDTLVSRMSPQWQNREVADVLRWLHDFNEGRTDKVRFVGVEFYLTPPQAYDDVETYVAKAAPDRLAELTGHLDGIRPPDDVNMYAYAARYDAVKDKRPFLRDAHAVRDIVASLPHRPGDRRHALALHTADQIVGFYEHYARSRPREPVYRDAHVAGNIRWWRALSHDKTAYWTAIPHTANAADMHITNTDEGGADLRFPSAGSYLRRWYGAGYRSVAFTFDHGEVSTGYGATAPMPPAADGWFEQPFGAVGLRQFAVDLRQPAPPPVRRWLAAPIVTRGLPNFGSGSVMIGGTAAQWFDLVIHRQDVTPANAP